MLPSGIGIYIKQIPSAHVITSICVMVCGQIKSYHQCFKSFVTRLCSKYSGHKLRVKPSKKRKQGTAYSSKVFIHQLCFGTQASGFVSFCNSDDTNLHQPSLKRVKLGTNLAFCAYNVSSQLISNIKGTFVEIPNPRKVMQVGMVNPFWLNGMETQGFPSAKPPRTAPAVQNRYSCQAQAKDTFDLLKHHNTKQL